MASDLSMSDAFFLELARVVEVNMEDEHFGANELAREVGLSRSQIHRKLKSITGKSTSQFIREIRLRQAHELLEDRVGTASEIAYKVGFNSSTYFTKCFHDYFGYPPGSVKILGSNLQLTAIMFTDIVGYTALMERNEQRAFQLLDENRKIQRPLIEKFNGKWLKEMGDGILASFTTVSDAVYCAGAIQKACENKPALFLRIGIHEGEVVFKDGDVFGSGVNIASRLESMSPGGGILISGSVYRNIKNKEGIKAEFLREETLKNVDEPIKIYQVKVEKDEPTENPPTRLERLPRLAGRKGVMVGAVVIILLLLGYAGYQYRSNNPPTYAPAAAEAEFDKSIAVLPFTNMSNDPEQQYFSDGIMEAILNNLSKIGELKVISRTSMMQYRDTEKTSPQIAEELGVAFLLEGGVQTIEGKVRISAQLIAAVQDKHVWSENYDRVLTDIFAIQSEIAQKIASELMTVLSPQEIEQIDKQRTDNLQAYNSYLRGRYFLNKRTEQSPKKSIEYFEQALAVDPEYALAHAGLADAYLLLTGRGYFPNGKGLTMAKKHALKALEIDPNLAEAHATRGYYLATMEWQWQEAETEFKRAIELNPNYVTGRRYYAGFLGSQGRFEEARKQMNRALELDPLSLIVHAVSTATYYNAGELDKAIKEIQKILELDKNQASPYWSLFIIHREQGRDKEAFKHLKKFWSLNGSQEYAELTEGIYNETGIDGVIRWWMDAEVNKSPNNPVHIARHYAILGEKDLALGWLERAFELQASLFYLKEDRMFESLRSEPRFIALLEKMGFKDDY